MRSPPRCLLLFFPWPRRASPVPVPVQIPTAVPVSARPSHTFSPCISPLALPIWRSDSRRPFRTPTPLSAPRRAADRARVLSLPGRRASFSPLGAWSCCPRVRGSRPSVPPLSDLLALRSPSAAQARDAASDLSLDCTGSDLPPPHPVLERSPALPPSSPGSSPSRSPPLPSSSVSPPLFFLTPIPVGAHPSQRRARSSAQPAAAAFRRPGAPKPLRCPPSRPARTQPPPPSPFHASIDSRADAPRAWGRPDRFLGAPCPRAPRPLPRCPSYDVGIDVPGRETQTPYEKKTEKKQTHDRSRLEEARRRGAAPQSPSPRSSRRGARRGLSRAVSRGPASPRGVGARRSAPRAELENRAPLRPLPRSLAAPPLLAPLPPPPAPLPPLCRPPRPSSPPLPPPSSSRALLLFRRARSVGRGKSIRLFPKEKAASSNPRRGRGRFAARPPEPPPLLPPFTFFVLFIPVSPPPIPPPPLCLCSPPRTPISHAPPRFALTALFRPSSRSAPPTLDLPAVAGAAERRASTVAAAPLFLRCSSSRPRRPLLFFCRSGFPGSLPARRGGLSWSLLARRGGLPWSLLARRSGLDSFRSCALPSVLARIRVARTDSSQYCAHRVPPPPPPPPPSRPLAPSPPSRAKAPPVFGRPLGLGRRPSPFPASGPEPPFPFRPASLSSP